MGDLNAQIDTKRDGFQESRALMAPQEKPTTTVRDFCLFVMRMDLSSEIRNFNTKEFTRIPGDHRTDLCLQRLIISASVKSGEVHFRMSELTEELI